MKSWLDILLEDWDYHPEAYQDGEGLKAVFIEYVIKKLNKWADEKDWSKLFDQIKSNSLTEGE